MTALAIVLSTLCTTAYAAPEYVRIVSVSNVNGKTSPTDTFVLTTGQTSIWTMRGDRTHPELTLILKPVVGIDNTITLETSIAVNRMFDTPAPTFDKRVAQITLRSKLGEAASIETDGGATYQWTGTRLSDAESAALHERQSIQR